jgi:Spy/CpxP family protein refolding chaperone
MWAAHAIGGERGNQGARSGNDSGGISCPLYRAIGANEQQLKELEPKLAEFRKSSKQICDDVAIKRGEMIDLLAAPQPDRTAIAVKQDEILAYHRKMQELVIEQLLAEKHVLTPEQQKDLFDLLRKYNEDAKRGPDDGR